MIKKSADALGEILMNETTDLREQLIQKDAIIELHRIENQNLQSENQFLKKSVQDLDYENKLLKDKISVLEEKWQSQSGNIDDLCQNYNHQNGKLIQKGDARTNDFLLSPENDQKLGDGKNKYSSETKISNFIKFPDCDTTKIEIKSEKILDDNSKGNMENDVDKNRILTLSPEEIISFFNTDNENKTISRKKRSTSTHRLSISHNQGTSIDKSKHYTTPGRNVYSKEPNSIKFDSEEQINSQAQQSEKKFKETPEGIKLASDPKTNPYLDNMDTIINNFVNNSNKLSDKLLEISRKRSTTENLTVDAIGLNKVYEDFFIFGSDKTSMKTFSADKELEISTLFSLYSPKDAESTATIKQLSKFVLPFSKKFRVVKMKNSFSKLQEIIFASKVKVDFSFFSLTADATAEMKLGKSQNAFIKSHPEFEIFKKTNPNRYFFYYCLRMEDFFIDNIKTNPKSNELIELYFYQKAFIIKTIYPFSKLFHDFLIQTMELLKRKRLASFASFNSDNKITIANLAKVDGHAFLDSEIEFFVATLQSMDGFGITNNFEKQFQLKIDDNITISYTLPALKHVYYTECEVGYSYIFNHFPFEDFMFIMFSIFYEKSIIFVSENLFLISACISTFLALFRPFKWPFPVIYSLPEDCLLMLGSPIPVMIGLNLPSFHVVNDILPEYESMYENNHNNNVYVFLDKGLFFYDFEKHDQLILPQFDNFLENMEKCYKKSFNQRSSQWFKVKSVKRAKMTEFHLKSNNPQRMKEAVLKLETVLIDKPSSKANLDSVVDIRYEPKIDDFSVFYQFSSFLENFILKKLTPQSSVVQKMGYALTEMDLCLFSNNANDLLFLHRFVKTQAFIHFIEHEICGITYDSNK